MFGFFGLSSLYLKSSTFHPLSLLRVDAQYPHGHCFCSGVTCALLLLFSLSSLQGVPGHWALKSHLPFLEPQAQPPQGVEGWGCLGCGPFCHVRFMGCTHVGKQQGTRFLEARFTSTAAPLSDCGRCCGWEARVVCGFPCCSQVLWDGRPSCCNHRATIAGTASAVPRFHLLYEFQFTHLQMYRYVEFSRVPCVGQRNLHGQCFAGCRLKGRDRVSHPVMMLMLTLLLSLIMFR